MCRRNPDPIVRRIPGARRGALLAVVLILAACAGAARPAEPSARQRLGRSLPGSAVRVRYAEPRDVVLFPFSSRGEPARAPFVMRRVREIAGRVRSQEGDTLALAPSQLRFAPGTPPQDLPRGVRLDETLMSVHAADDTRIDVLARWPGPTTFLAWALFLSPIYIFVASLPET